MNSLNIKWRIDRKPIPYPTTTDYTYTGETVTPVWANLDEGITASGTLSATDEGEYTATFTLDENHCWEDKSTDSYSATWKILQKSVVISTVPAQSGTLTYTGKALSPVWSNYNPEQLELVALTPQTNAGTYTAMFAPKKVGNIQYTWDDGTTTAKSVPWTIDKAQVTVPSFYNDESEFTYTGGNLGPTLQDQDPKTTNVSGDTLKTNAGDYTLTVSLKDTDNYEWATGGTENVELTWSIKKITLTVPTVAYNVTYNGSATEVPLIGLDTDKMTLGGQFYATNAGSYTATVSLKDTTNYEWEDHTSASKEITWEIAKAVVQPPILTGTYVYTGEELTATFTGYNTERMTVSGDLTGTALGKYTVYFTLDPNYRWATTTNVDEQGRYVLEWEITSAGIGAPTISTLTFTYNKTTQSIALSTAETPRYVLSGDTQKTAAGTYTAYAVPATGYSWNNTVETDDQGRYVITWTIEPAVLTLPTIKGTYTYTGEAQTVEFENYDTQVLSVAADSLTQTNAGAYTLYFTKINDNYKWPEGTTTDDQGRYTLEWTITTAGVDAPTISALSFTYDKEAHSIALSETEAPYYVLSGDTSKTDAGTYTAYIVPAVGYSWNETVETDDQGRYIVEWKIKPAVLTLPSIKGTYTYTGSPQTVELENYDTEILSISGSRTATNAGSHVLKFVKINDNYTWPGGTDLIQNEGETSSGETIPMGPPYWTLSWTIEKATVALPSISGTNTYSDTPQSPTITGMDETIFELFDTELPKSDAGTYDIKLKLKDKYNYKWPENTTLETDSATSTEYYKLQWTIVRAVIATPTIKGSLIANGSAQSPVLSNSTGVVLSGDTEATEPGTYSLIVTPDSNHCWWDSSTSPVTLPWSIQATVTAPVLVSDFDGTYTGEELSPVTGYDPNTMTYTGDLTAAEVGDYTVTFTLKEGNVWAEGTTTNDDGQVVLTWSITKADGEMTVSPESLSIPFGGNSMNGYMILYPEMLQVEAPRIVKTLTQCTPEEIQAIVTQGKAPSSWAVGDLTAPIAMNGTVGQLAINSSYCGKLIGLDHNTKLESDGKWNAHFKVPYGTDGKQLCFVDPLNGQMVSLTAQGFCMNRGDSSNNYGGNAGGWKNSYARSTLMPQFLAAMPEEWQAIISETTKYTDNVGNGTTAASNVTATQDKMFYLAEYEMFGIEDENNSLANIAEPQFQKHYAYYANHTADTDHIHYAHNAATTGQHTWTRSPRRFNATGFVVVDSTGGLAGYYACYSHGAALAFAVIAA